MIAGAIFFVGAIICFQNFTTDSEAEPSAPWGIYGLIMILLGCLCMGGVLSE